MEDMDPVRFLALLEALHRPQLVVLWKVGHGFDRRLRGYTRKVTDCLCEFEILARSEDGEWSLTELGRRLHSVVLLRHWELPAWFVLRTVGVGQWGTFGPSFPHQLERYRGLVEREIRYMPEKDGHSYTMRLTDDGRRVLEESIEERLASASVDVL